MRPHPKIRKTVKWGGAAASVLLAVVWVGSGSWRVGYTTPQGYGGTVVCGRITLGYWASRFPASVTLDHGTAPVKFRRETGFKWRNVKGSGWVWGLSWGIRPWESWFALPLWVIVALMSLGSGAAWRLDALARHRQRTGKCPKCGYDRAGIPAGAICPECGAGAEKAELYAKGAKQSEEGSGK